MLCLLQFYNADFENENINLVEKSMSSVNKENEKNKPVIQMKNKGIEKDIFDSEILNKVLDTDFATQTSNIEVSIDTTELPLPLTTDVNKEEVFRFYWWDAYEDPFKQPGVVYLFGKVFVPSVKAYCSCCLTVKNIPRRIYLLPRVYVCMNTYKNIVLTMLKALQQ